MKAERTEPKQEFVPVIVTLESQEEVDSLFAIVNHIKICNALPALDSWYREIEPFASNFNLRGVLCDKLNQILD